MAPRLEALYTLNTKDGETTILRRLCQTKEDDPQQRLRSDTYGKEHLGKRDSIKGYGTEKHYDTCTE
jgi:hypothetical protein